MLIVVQLLQAQVLLDPLLSVSPWLEARRDEHQDALEASVNDSAQRLETVRQLSVANGETCQANSNAVNEPIEPGMLEEMATGARRIIRAPDVAGPIAPRDCPRISDPGMAAPALAPIETP